MEVGIEEAPIRLCVCTAYELDSVYEYPTDIMGARIRILRWTN